VSSLSLPVVFIIIITMMSFFALIFFFMMKKSGIAANQTGDQKTVRVYKSGEN